MGLRDLQLIKELKNQYIIFETDTILDVQNKIVSYEVNVLRGALEYAFIVQKNRNQSREVSALIEAVIESRKDEVIFLGYVGFSN